MIIRLTYLASAFSLAAASKSSKSSVTAPTAPVDTAKAGKSASASVSLSLSPKSGKSSGPTPTDAAKAAKSSSPNASKSGKSSKAGEYFMAPFSCPQKCISGQNYAMLSGEIDNAVMVCDASNEYQMWKVHIDGTFLKFESVAHNDEGMCLAVGEECSGLLGLADCNDPETKWFETGGQLLSASCWNQGISAALSVDAECKDLTVDAGSSDDPITRLQTFMLLESDFVESIIVPSQAPSVSLAPTVTP
uniref:Ricin B lectin domain-containing protein n=1 Tax=Skeletonema marinoi TaxID=267567 RepID=A0A7S2LM52_9STRA|mmetsp:Transcript_27076/g.45877  ORF Transcript_27076/g.45877 Transcript_27076/m.45877 type:complete len:248 (+) Transcript_27076:67-810(+)